VSAFQFFLFLHVMGAILAFGPTFAYSIIGGMGGKEPMHANFATRVTERIGTRLVYPLAIFQGITGLALMLIAGITAPPLWFAPESQRRAGVWTERSRRHALRLHDREGRHRLAGGTARALLRTRQHYSAARCRHANDNHLPLRPHRIDAAFHPDWPTFCGCRLPTFDHHGAASMSRKPLAAWRIRLFLSIEHTC
jgi:hypothetical protein